MLHTHSHRPTDRLVINATHTQQPTDRRTDRLVINATHTQQPTDRRTDRLVINATHVTFPSYLTMPLSETKTITRDGKVLTGGNIF